MLVPYPSRTHAGRILAEALAHLAERPNLLVVGLPRGGVPVGYAVAETLGAPLDVFVVRKLGVPGHEELAMGAIATGGVRVLNPEVLEALGITRETVEAVAKREREELARREQLYRGDRPRPRVLGRCVVVIDDGLATGASMRVAVRALRQQHADEVIVAVPVAPPETVGALRSFGVDVVCPLTPEPFFGVGRWYDDFEQTTDAEVRDLLERAWTRMPVGTRR